MAKILCVDDDAAILQILQDGLVEAGHRSPGATSVAEALRVLQRGGIDLVISDYRMPGADGFDLLASMAEQQLDVPLIMVTGHGGIEHAVRAIKAGAVDYITKPVRPRQLALAVEQALEFTRLRRENARYKEELTTLRGTREIVGESEAMTRILDTIRIVAPTRTTVLLQGESGTGKELFARTIHGLSDRADGPFISINCAALPEGLIESTLFGHEKGAFTGAISQVKGAFERAHMGTLLLDEISEMRLDLQAKLLRVLQEQEFERVGGASTIKVDTRIIATTNRSLPDEVKAGRFREDLYYRLGVVPMLVPPIRERMDDIPLLVQHFAHRIAKDLGREITGVAPETVELLQAYDWPGNVRELAHAVERAIILSTNPILEPDAFDRERFGLAAGPRARATDGDRHGSPEKGGFRPIHLDSHDIRSAESVLIARALEETGQNRTKAAELLGISVRTLRNRLNG